MSSSDGSSSLDILLDGLQQASASPATAQQYVLELLAAAVAAYSAAVWPTRPRGWCCRGLVQVR